MPRLRVSLRELLVVLVAVALGLAGLLSGGVAAAIVTAAAWLAVPTAAIVIGFAPRRSLRVAAWGFLIPVVCYGLTLFTVQATHVLRGGQLRDEFTSMGGMLPSSRLVGWCHRRVVRTTYTDTATGQPLPRDEVGTYDFPSADARAGGGGALILRSVDWQESPSQAEFMVLGHSLVAAILGYLGGKLALALHRGRGRRPAPPAADGPWPEEPDRPRG